VAGHHFEKIYSHGLGKKCEVFREAAIIPNFAAVSGELVSAGSDGHPTQKPLSLMRKLITRIPKGSVIFDPFSGSGTTLEAAKELGYEVIGCELQEKWCSATVSRLAQMSFSTLPNKACSGRVDSSGSPELFPAEVIPSAKVTRQSTRR
jgi:site-specific DNA-methyltransferase (adenine-specific)